MKALFIALICLISLPTPAQNKAIGSKEKLVFTASYKMSGLMTDLAQVTMETSQVKTASSTLLRLKCKARTFKKWDSYFKINDLYESYVSPKTLRPYLHNREINEGNYYKFMQYKYDYKAKVIQSLQRKRGRDGSYYDVRNRLNFGSSTIDLVSTIYKIRNLDIKKAAIGSSDSFSVIFDNQKSTVRVTLLAKETIKTKIGTKACYKLAISLNNSDILKGSNDNLIWLTADENKIPVYAKFKVAIGSGELKIESASGLKN
ncbi:MAG: DUF3108 domain-containing protein [Bacteroidia bacterium]|nr:DUF3108 domain-containing protein [Bacteroidia bacterium]NND26689.1 DUF3108 domain-containing protein [Flavobacteriaceae bacterium]MBT8277928.1 DUF3108 domain-containing protein [Bacteroidia bacterium]NNK59145.1 DUF3108 domain-containing protein [Flavobacteriaceae bacterium]NNL32206.1 DUF3108 domain-containing protein [Flavobacteriaceae bacterium]